MPRTLVVPLDGSALAERALPYAVALASAPDSRLLLVRVAFVPTPLTIEGAGWEDVQDAEIDAARQYLAAVAARLGSSVVVATEVSYGPAAPHILDAVSREAADGVVMTTHGRTGLAHLLHGSVAEAVLAGSDVPVLLVSGQPGQVPAAPFNPTNARVLVPLDGSAFAEAALATAVQFLDGDSVGRELVLATVATGPDHVERDEAGHAVAYLDQQEEATTRGAREYLDHIARQVRELVPGVTVAIDVRIGAPGEGIAMAVAAHHIDLIVMSTHARTGIQRARLGSVAGAIVRSTSTPVLLVRPEAALAAAVNPPGRKHRLTEVARA